MRIRMTRKAGQPGTLSELATYGDKLICVRYRYDTAAHRRHKTVELIVESIEWHPPGCVITPETIVSLRIARDERALQAQVKRAHAIWDAKLQRWRLPYAAATSLGLADRIDWAIV